MMKRPKKSTPTNADALKLDLASRPIFRLIDEVRSIIDTDPIDIPRLEASLREAIGSVRDTRAALAVAKPDKKINAFLDCWDGYFKMLLTEIIGPQH
jgi:hypothetical protein